jgi:cyanate permease
VVFLVSVPLTWFFIRPHRPEYYGLLPDGDSKAVAKYQTDSKLTLPADRYELTEFTFRQTVRTSSYWLYIVIIAISNFCTPMMNVHFVPFLTDGGIEPIQAASMLGLIFTLNIPARLIGGFVADRVKTGQLRYIIALGVFLQACGVATYLVCRNIQGIYAWIILYGFGLGVAQSSLFPLIVRYFGRKAFGSITGLTAMLQMPVGLLSPIFIGWTYDNYGSYTHIIVIMAVVLTAGGIIAFFIRRPKLPELTSDTSETAR